MQNAININYKNVLDSFEVVTNIYHRCWSFVHFNLTLNFFLILFFLNFFVIKTKIKHLKKTFIIFTNIWFFFFDFFTAQIKNIRYSRFFVLIFSVFFFVLFSNLGSFFLIEISFTAHIVIALFLSFIVFFNFVITFCINFNESVYKKFMQKNLSLMLTLILFFVELISYFVRPFSLGIRLFANILSGHILMHIFFGSFVYIFQLIAWLSLFFFLFCLFIFSMEIFVSIVQAYIFFILCTIYLKDTIFSH